MLPKIQKSQTKISLPNTQQVIIQHLEKRLKYFKGLLDYAPDIIVAGDTTGRIVEINKGIEKLLGYKREEVIGKKHIKDLYFRPHDRERLMKLVWSQGEVIDYDIRLKSKSGKIKECSTTLALLRDDAGKVIGTIGIARDISRRKRLGRQLAKMAITDGLTRLYDRGYFNQEVYRVVDKAHKSNRPLFLVLFDLDGFKAHNDKYGHLAGDEVLRRVGQIVLKSIRPRIDKAFRYGGDEFIIILPEFNPRVIDALAEKIRKKVAQHCNSQITTSIGITKLRDRQGVHKFIRAADKAMYRAKAGGGNKVCSIIL